MEYIISDSPKPSYKKAYLYNVGGLCFGALFLLLMSGIITADVFPRSAYGIAIIFIFAFAQMTFMGLTLRELGKLKDYQSTLGDFSLPHIVPTFSILVGLAVTAIYLSVLQIPISGLGSITPYFLGLFMPLTLFFMAGAYFTAFANAE